MKAVLLCGGVGKRMFPLNEDKFLFRFLGRTLLEYQIECLQRAGIKDFLIVANPGNMEKTKTLLVSVKGVSADFVLQPHPRGMGDALMCAEKAIGDQPIWVVSPNDVLEADAYLKLKEAAAAHPAVGAILCYRVKGYFPGGYLVTDGEGWLRGIQEKPEAGKEPSDLVNIVVHYFPRPARFFQALRETGAAGDSAYEGALDRMVKLGEKVRAVPYEGFWGAVKYPWHLFRVMEQFLGRLKGEVSPSAQVSKWAVLDESKGGIVLEDEVKVLEHAIIRGPCYIGPGAIIGNNALVRDGCHIGAGCVVGFSTEIKHSYIGPRCWFHSNYIGDSIIGDDCTFGAGTVTANFRFDQRNIRIQVADDLIDTGTNKMGAIIGDSCQTGVHCTLLPGVRLGRNSILGPHLCLHRDLPPDARAF